MNKNDAFDEFQNLTAKISEMYDEYLLIVKPHTKSIMWKYADSSWALGAAKRMVNFIETDDRVSNMDMLTDKENNE